MRFHTDSAEAQVVHWRAVLLFRLHRQYIFRSQILSGPENKFKANNYHFWGAGPGFNKEMKF